jgi:hypothetical protein
MVCWSLLDNLRTVTCKVRRVAFNIRFCLAVGFALDRVGQTACRIWQRDYVGLLNLITRFVEFDRVIKFERQQFVQSFMSGLKFSITSSLPIEKYRQSYVRKVPRT